MLRKINVLAAVLVLSALNGFSQELLDGIQIHGNIDIYGQTYNKDSIIGAPVVPEKAGLNTFTNLIATKGAFTAGVRFESYMPPIQGFDNRYGNQKVGIPYRFVNFVKEGLDITVGNFYEQFGPCSKPKGFIEQTWNVCATRWNHRLLVYCKYCGDVLLNPFKTL